MNTDYEQIRAAALDGARKTLADAARHLEAGRPEEAAKLCETVLAVQTAAALHADARRLLARASGDYPEHTVPRSGRPPLRFRGELLAAGDGYLVRGKEQTRWHELAVYRTAGGKFVVHVGYRTRFQGEVDDDRADVVDHATGVGSALADYDPAGRVKGFPPGEAYAERQERLLADLRQRYAAQVSEVLASDPEFAEVVE